MIVIWTNIYIYLILYYDGLCYFIYLFFEMDSGFEKTLLAVVLINF